MFTCVAIDNDVLGHVRIHVCRSIVSPGHVYLFGCDQRQRSQQSKAIIAQRLTSFVTLACGGFGIHDDTDTIWNDEYTARACRLAIGNTIELTKCIVDGQLRNGFALVRPPGHHATQKPSGFCYFNTIAITAKYLKKHRNLERIAIVDWDIHHGNGTQDLTYDDPNILYISLHRYDNGTFFPGFGRIEEVRTGTCPGVSHTSFIVDIAILSADVMLVSARMLILRFLASLIQR
jgi:histone deacetylase 4/5